MYAQIQKTEKKNTRVHCVCYRAQKGALCGAVSQVRCAGHLMRSGVLYVLCVAGSYV
jgi:hypothetical protein